jgi:hypothetical protein
MKQNKFSLVIDSSFRTKRLYPISTKFQIPINDIVTNEYLNSPLKAFSWGEPLLNRTGTIVGGNQQNIIISQDLVIQRPNYYVGCMLVLYDSSSNIIESAYIKKYNYNDKSVTLQYPLSSSISTNTVINIVYPNSITNPYTIQILGYDEKNIFEYNNIYIYNYSKKWIRQIKIINSLGLANLTEQIPITEYSPLDIFEIRTSPNIAQYTLNNSFESITNYNILPGTFEYDIGSLVYIIPDSDDGTRQIFKVNGQNVFSVVEYGGPFILQKSYPLYPFDEIISNVQILSKVIVIQTSYVVDGEENNIPDPSNHVIYFSSERTFSFFDSLVFYNYRIDRQYIILIDPLIKDDPIKPPVLSTEYGFIHRNVVTCSMNVPNWSFPQNPICMKISIDTLILPNLYVKNFNKLLSFFPYVIVRFYNTDAAQYSRYGNIISNNLNSSNAQFICPIGNLQNPEIIRFVEVSSDTIQYLKFDPTQNIYFEVLLPDGTTLEYQDIVDFEYIDDLQPYRFTITDTVACLLSLTIDL